jgi:flagellar motor switch protein FliM
MGGWDDGGGEAGSERILNQDEIDSLLGFDLSGDGGEDRTGIRAIINSALVSYERLPMLEIVFDRLVRLMTTSCGTSRRTTSRSASTTSARSASATI